MVHDMQLAETAVVLVDIVVVLVDIVVHDNYKDELVHEPVEEVVLAGQNSDRNGSNSQTQHVCI